MAQADQPTPRPPIRRGLEGFPADELDKVRGYVRSSCPAWLASEEDDLVQMVLVRVARARTRPSQPAAYLQQAAHDTVSEEVHRRRRRAGVRRQNTTLRKQPLSTLP
jgi:DNA-directed RNA polymerase specialized sigma24 family protein